jgi:hypothetical protein
MPYGFPERLFPHAKYDFHRMRVFALAISWISIVYNGVEGGVSIGLGIDVASRALIVFGIQSLVEVLSAALVIYRFRRELDDSSPFNIALEKRATLGIGLLFILLTIGTWVASIVALATRAQPDSSIPSLIVSASALLLMLFIWLPKPWIAAELNSSVMRGEAACSLACIYLTIVLFVGSLVYKVWHGGWWIDSAVAILLGFFFLHQGWEMVAWARHNDFNGGCCQTCAPAPATISLSNKAANSDNCTSGCSQTCSASQTTTSSSNTATKLITEYKNVEKCDCCVDGGTCICRPTLVEKTSSNGTVGCSDSTKCSTYGSTAVFP